MDKDEFKSMLTANAGHPQTVRGIFNWCDQWCERCSKTENCTVYKTSVHLPSDKPEDLYKTLSMVFETTMDMLKEYAAKNGIDFESLKDSDCVDEYDRKRLFIRNDDGLTLAKQYAQQVKQWMDSLHRKEPV